MKADDPGVGGGSLRHRLLDIGDQVESLSREAVTQIQMHEERIQALEAENATLRSQLAKVNA